MAANRSPLIYVGVALVGAAIGFVIGSRGTTSDSGSNLGAPAVVPSMSSTRDDERNISCDVDVIDSLLAVIENRMVPLTAEGVRGGSKLFGAAILNRADLSPVVVATNNEIENPLWHGEVHAIKLFYELPEAERPDPRDLIFLSSHEPCPLCLSAITWGGYKTVYFLFSYEDSRDSFNIPHDLRILKEVFTLDPGGYNKKNYYWEGYGIRELIDRCDADQRQVFNERIAALSTEYEAMSAIYQASKGNNQIPLD